MLEFFLITITCAQWVIFHSYFSFISLIFLKRFLNHIVLHFCLFAFSIGYPSYWCTITHVIWEVFNCAAWRNGKKQPTFSNVYNNTKIILIIITQKRTHMHAHAHAQALAHTNTCTNEHTRSHTSTRAYTRIHAHTRAHAHTTALARECLQHSAWFSC